MVTGSSIWLKVPPYDNYGQWSAGNAHASADVFAGRYSIVTDLDVRSAAGWAGIAINFFATEFNPNQRFSALVDYDYAWGDYSAYGTAHNDGGTNIWIWGFAENNWVFKNPQALDPSWSDGTSWFEVHDAFALGQDGRENLDVSFPALPNNWYQAWVWSSGSCDADFDIGCNASQYQAMSVPFVVFGSL